MDHPGPTTTTPRPALALVFLLALCSFLFFYRLADRDLWSSHEARAAQDAQTVLEGGRWGLPGLFSGQDELQKPPLYYWLVALTARCGGGTVDAWAVRLPAALAGVGCVLALYLFGLRRGRPRIGLVAACVLATALHFTWLARVGRIDLPLTCTVAVALLGFYRAATTGPQFASLLPAYLAVALGLLLKGPIAAVLPAAVAGAFLLVERELPAPWRLRDWRRLAHRFGVWWGVPLTLAVALPWFVWANAETGGELFRVFVWHHNVERGLGGSDVLRAHPWWFYVPHLAADFLPWSLPLPVAGWCFLRRREWRADREARFGLVWLVVVLSVLSCARFKRADYLLPAFPGAALFLGCVAERWYATAHRPRRLSLAFGGVVAGCVAGWWWYVDGYLPRAELAWEQRRFAAEIRRHAPAPEPVLFFRTESHALAFHVGRPLAIRVQWEDLDAWVARPDAGYVVMPVDSAAQWPQFVKSGRLEEVLRDADLPGPPRERPLVLLRAHATPPAR